MGLLDVLNGMQQGPRGPSNPSAQSSGGMSPMTMALLGLLAWKAIKHMTAGQPGAAPQPAPAPAGGGAGGGFGEPVLKGPLGGLLAGGAAGSVISAGSATCSSNCSRAASATPQIHGSARVTTKRLHRAISPRRSAPTRSMRWPRKAGLSRDELLNGLSQYLPQVIDHLTPDGRLPTESEVSGRL